MGGHKETGLAEVVVYLVSASATFFVIGWILWKGAERE